ncbi:hypothetical protein M5K25_025327 [Dendrobium thyrsiflorum]|uniref:Uncharacterized protein n=1 Tax=Dendrobium thyrsiflorum TaxID=117978 RepID=A0ABD0U465_DENTH
MARPPGCGTQKIEFQSEMPNGVNASSKHLPTFLETICGTSLWSVAKRPPSLTWPPIAPAESGNKT